MVFYRNRSQVLTLSVVLVRLQDLLVLSTSVVENVYLDENVISGVR